jgi:hypothetical protein
VARIASGVESTTSTGGGMHWLGTALIDIYEAREEHAIKADLLDRVVAIMRREDGREARVREIAKLMRDWQQQMDSD